MTASPFPTLHERIEKARRRLNHDNWDYLVGGADYARWSESFPGGSKNSLTGRSSRR